MSVPRPTQTKCWILSNKPHGITTTTGENPTFTLTTRPLPPMLEPNHVLVKTIYFSNEPAQRSWINAFWAPERMYIRPVSEGEVMSSLGIGEVLESSSPKFQVGDHVSGLTGWTEYSVMSETGAVPLLPLRPLPGGLGETHYLGALGLTGLTAYLGLVRVGRLKGSESVLVSGAAGATGSMVVQLAKKVLGARSVIGIAGSDEKCRWVESLGADRCVNYKSPSFSQDLKEAAKDGVDLYFDNVGGVILDEALGLLNVHGRVVACGFISTYNDEDVPPLRNWWNVVSMKLEIQGFVVLEFAEQWEEAIGVIAKGLAEGKILLGPESETIVKGALEDVPAIWRKLFEGGNIGKLVTSLQ
ncbi:hypothetical protein BDW62DRAFT_143133 [Aspergillus aurantiobrunneus]